jgi:bifunctional DNA-binding transcriptional regulator/antitoxin component of YhaV-PrlF toxin-antitoxin module
MNIFSRKITKVGRSGLAIILPISWTRGENIQKGDFVELIEQDGVITIKSKKAQLQKPK